MPDEHYQRYNRYTHDQLYRQLHQGSPATLSRQADAWRRAGETAATLANTLRQDLVRLATRWTGLGSDEFESRIGLIATYAQELADEAASINVGTEAMARALAEGQRQAEPNPAAPGAVGSDPATLRATLLNAATNGSTPEAVLGPALGHVPPPEQQSAAYERMVTLVAELAVLYGVVDQAKFPAAIPDAPAGMPGTETAVTDQVAAPTGGLAGVGVSGPSMLGSTGQFPGGTGLALAAGAVPGAIGGTVPAAVLSGAAPGLAGASKASVNTSTVAAPAAGAPSAALTPGAMPMMTAGPVIGQQAAGGGIEAGADWWAGPGAAWVSADNGGTEPPDPVVDGST